MPPIFEQQQHYASTSHAPAHMSDQQGLSMQYSCYSPICYTQPAYYDEKYCECVTHLCHLSFILCCKIGSHILSNLATSSRSSPITYLSSGHQSFSATPRTDSSSSTVDSSSHTHSYNSLRSDHVMWCGNIPVDATNKELWDYFSQLQLFQGSLYFGHGIRSIYLMARTHCAFVNYASSFHLQQAVGYFHRRMLRPDMWSSSPVLECRERNIEGGGLMAKERADNGSLKQAHDGRHVESELHSTRIKPLGSLQASLSRPLPRKPRTDQSGYSRQGLCEPEIFKRQLNCLESPKRIASKKILPQKARPYTPHVTVSAFEDALSSDKLSSTEFLNHPAFRERFFVMKSSQSTELDRSVRDGSWLPIKANADVLHQAVRNSESVYLIFGAEQSDCFYGYARITESTCASDNDQMDKGCEISQSSNKETEISAWCADICISDDPPRKQKVRPQANCSIQRSTSCPPAIPVSATVKKTVVLHRQRCRSMSLAQGNQSGMSQHERCESLDNTSRSKASSTQVEAASPSASSVDADDQDQGKVEYETSSLSRNSKRSLKLEWLQTSPLGFSRLNNLRNPWWNDNEVQDSLDGTELEPDLGRLLLKTWRCTAEEQHRR